MSLYLARWRTYAQPLDPRIIQDPSMHVIPNPPDDWLTHLRRGCQVWLPKAHDIGEIEFPYEPPEPGYITGYIGVRVANHSIQRWHIGPNGEGLDGIPLMQPLEGHLPENPEPLPEPMVRQVLHQLEAMEKRINKYEAYVITLQSNMLAIEAFASTFEEFKTELAEFKAEKAKFYDSWTAVE